MNIQPKHVLLTAMLTAGVLVSVVTAAYAYYTNGGFGFPLDDPWIHLQFAKNLHEYGSFSYYRSEMATSGSTSPLYTLLLTVGFFFTGNEMVLSYVLGVSFLLLAAAYFFKLAEYLFSDKLLYAAAATLLLLTEPHLHWIALSGMETTLFILLLVAVIYYYMTGRALLFGIAAGLLIWTRPEAVILMGVLAMDVVYRRYIVQGESTEQGWTMPSAGKALVVIALFAMCYAAFNLLLSGSVLPNTYAAKLKYYSSGGQDFPMQVFRYFTSGHLMAFAPAAGIGMVAVLVRVFRRKQSSYLVPLMFCAGLFGAYWMKLPYLYQNGRYLMPIIPFFILLGIMGTDEIMTFIRKRIKGNSPGKSFPLVEKGLLALFVVVFVYGSWESRIFYQDYCKYITDRQVRTAHWIRDHLPEGSVVATHDVGAIAYYSGRKIVDMVGLISPEAIEKIGDLHGLAEFLSKQDVTHLALLRNWFEVVNVDPLFRTNEQRPEIMEVFAFDPERIHFTSKEVNWLTDTGWLYLSRGDVQNGGPLVERAVQLDPQSSRAHHHFAWALMMIGQFDRAEEELYKAIEIHPEYWNAHFALAQVPLRQNKIEEAVARLQDLLHKNPKMLAAYQVLEQIYHEKGDMEKAQFYRNEFEKGAGDPAVDQ